MGRKLLLVVLVVWGLGISHPSQAAADAPTYKYRVFYQSKYNGEIRKSRNDYDTRQQADQVAADLRLVHAVSRAWVTMVRVEDNQQGGGKYFVGQKVWAKWRNKWWNAKILQVSGNSYYISYPGWPSSWNEWVGPDRLSK